MSANLCEHCTGMCCRYVALPIEEPESREDFDDIRWYIMHEGVSVFVEDGQWYIYFLADCRHLQPDYRCGIYQSRPRICRNYTTDNCDYHSGEYGWEQHFTCPEHLDEYLRTRPPATGTRRRPTSRPGVRVRRRPRPTQADIAGVPLPVLEERP